MKRIFTSLVFCALAFSAFSQTPLWEEKFEGAGLPAGWTQTTSATDGGWIVANTVGLASNSFPVPVNDGKAIGTNDDKCNCNKGNDFIATPPLDLSGQTKLYMVMDLLFGAQTYQGATEKLAFEASIDGGVTWDIVKQFGPTGGWNKAVNVDISAYAGLTAVQFGWRYNDGGGWLYGAALDNPRILIPDNVLKATLIGGRASRKIDAVPEYANYLQVFAGTPLVVTGTVNNPGFLSITSFDASYTTGAGTVTESFTGLDIAFGESFGFEMDEHIIAQMGPNDVTVKISNINGGDDNDLSDNEGANSVEGVGKNPYRKVLAEEGTGTWCGWCPRGAVWMDFLAENYPNDFIGVAVHNGSTEPMKVVAYDAAIGFTAFPSAHLDRFNKNIDPSQLEEFMITRMQESVPAYLHQVVTFDEATRIATINPTVNFLEDLNGDFRLAVIISEDEVKGTATGYAQVNYYTGGGYGPMGGFQSLPATVPAAQMVYNHVGRALVGTFQGQAGTIPAANLAGSSVAGSFTYTVPATQNNTKMHAITVLRRVSTGEIVNSIATPIPGAFTGSNDLNAVKFSLSLSPNPANEIAYIELNLEETADAMVRIFDALGNQIAFRNYENLSGEHVIEYNTLDLPTGMYTVNVTVDSKSVAKRLVVTH